MNLLPQLPNASSRLISGLHRALWYFSQFTHAVWMVHLYFVCYHLISHNKALLRESGKHGTFKQPNKPNCRPQLHSDHIPPDVQTGKKVRGLRSYCSLTIILVMDRRRKALPNSSPEASNSLNPPA